MKDKVNNQKKRLIKIIFTIVLFVFIALQFIRPGIPNPPVTGDIQVPAEIKSILRRDCYNCHSNETKLSWYDQINPAYWLVRDHVMKGRKVLNFSEWDRLAAPARTGALWESINQVIAGAMPIPSYTFVHRSANFSPQEIEILKNYIAGIPVSQPADSIKIASLASQFIQLQNANPASSNLPQALNGIKYMPEYKYWQMLSATDRFDNGSMRVILGNDIVMKAISESKTNPWPEGSVFAKVAWEVLNDGNGKIKTGAFQQVEYMIKDNKKYPETEGWGFARFKTAAMVPYGKSALFASECINCHRPLKDNDFVFTEPVKFIPASLPVSLQSTQNAMHVISSSIDKKDSSMSVLFENKKDSSSLTLITWDQKPDEHWFGARIPGSLRSVETIEGRNYKRYTGKTLQSDTDTSHKSERMKNFPGLEPSLWP